MNAKSADLSSDSGRRVASRQPDIFLITGSGHSGSTLLDMLLGGHPRVSSLGEAVFLYFNINSYLREDVCTCGRHVTDCPFWSEVERAAQKVMGTNGEPAIERLTLTHPDLRGRRDAKGGFPARAPGERREFASYLNHAVMLLGSRRLRAALARLNGDVALMRRASRDALTLYDAVYVAHGTTHIVDSTKNASYVKGIYMERPTAVRMIRLWRDGRAVCASRMRREHVNMEDAARLWRSEQLKQDAIALSVPSDRIIHIRYENLCERPEQELTTLCASMGLQFEKGMLDIRYNRHNLGGNPMRHRHDEVGIRLDERWRSQLSAQDLATFERIAGRRNRARGYVD